MGLHTTAIDEEVNMSHKLPDSRAMIYTQKQLHKSAHLKFSIRFKAEEIATTTEILASAHRQVLIPYFL